MKYLELYSTLKSHILTGKDPINSKLPNTKELIEQYNVSLTTVNNAMKLLEKEGFIKRVRSRGTFVIRDKENTYLESQKSKRVGFILPGNISWFMFSHYARQAFRGIETVLRTKGFRLVIIAQEDKPTEELLQEVHSSNLSAVIIFSLYNKQLFNDLRSRKVPVVYCDHIDYSLKAYQVTYDHMVAGSVAVNRLLELGHRKFLFFGNYHKHEERVDKDHQYVFHAIETELKFSHLKHLYPYFIPIVKTEDDLQGYKKMEATMVKALESHSEINAFFCASQTYFELLKKVIEKDDRYKERELDVVLFSDWTKEQFLNGKQIYQCSWDTNRVGALAAELILEILDGGPYKPTVEYVPVTIR